MSKVAVFVVATHLFVVLTAVAASRQPHHERLLTAISVSPSSINPSSGETATLHVSLARAARIDVQLVDRDGYVIRTFPTKRGGAGDNVLSWDGRDDRGDVVPDEAWSWRVLADGGADAFFPAAEHALMNTIDPLAFSRVSATLRYKLAVPSRVHVQAGTIAGGGAARTGEGPVLKTIVDREPRGAGFVAEHWNGFDASGAVYVPDLPGFAIAIAATPLPEQSVITFGNTKRRFLDYAAQREGRSLFPHQPPAAHHHGLDVFHDLAPRLTLAPSDGRAGEDGTWVVSDRTIRLRLRADGPTARAFQGEPGTIFVFIDGTLVDTRDAKHAAELIQLRLPDDAEHRIAVNWRSAYGPVAVAVARVRAPLPSNSATEHAR